MESSCSVEELQMERGGCLAVHFSARTRLHSHGDGRDQLYVLTTGDTLGSVSRR